MPRKPRLDYRGATHHVFVRGVARSVIATDDADYERALFFLERTVARFEITCHSWCYMPNHTHLLVTSQLGNLSKAMHWLGMNTAQTFNRRHERSGHLYQGRFGSRLVDSDAYLLELARYLPRNPVRAELCEAAAEWPWSSYSSTVGIVTPPWFLDTSRVLEELGSSRAFAAWVAEDDGGGYLDADGFPLPPVRIPLDEILSDFSDDAIAIAYYEHGYSMAAIARHLGISPAQIRRRLTQ
jgi:putative transposase